MKKLIFVAALLTASVSGAVSAAGASIGIRVRVIAPPTPVVVQEVKVAEVAAVDEEVAAFVTSTSGNRTTITVK